MIELLSKEKIEIMITERQISGNVTKATQSPYLNGTTHRLCPTFIFSTVYVFSPVSICRERPKVTDEVSMQGLP